MDCALSIIAHRKNSFICIKTLLCVSTRRENLLFGYTPALPAKAAYKFLHCDLWAERRWDLPWNYTKQPSGRSAPCWPAYTPAAATSLRTRRTNRWTSWSCWRRRRARRCWRTLCKTVRRRTTPLILAKARQRNSACSASSMRQIWLSATTS